MDILDKINQDHTDFDGPSSSLSPMGTEGVDVSTNGTVTFKQRMATKPVIPDSFVNPSLVSFCALCCVVVQHIAKMRRRHRFSLGAQLLLANHRLVNALKPCRVSPSPRGLDMRGVLLVNGKPTSNMISILTHFSESWGSLILDSAVLHFFHAKYHGWQKLGVKCFSIFRVHRLVKATPLW